MNSPSRRGTVNRWAVPLFLVGAASLTAALGTHSLWLRPDRCERIELAQLRRALERADQPPQSIVERAQLLVDSPVLTPSLRGEAHFVLGSALVREARQSPPAGARELWQRARRHLGEAEQLGTAEPDQPLLRYRLALCDHRLGARPEDVAPRLEASVAVSDHPVEAYGVLTEAYLRCNPPNLSAALAANERLRQLPLLGEEVLGPARMQAADLLFRLNRPAEARKTLEMVGRAGDPGLHSRARLLRAESLQQESKWTDAAKLWQQVVEESSAGPRELALYQLGSCLWQLERFDDAAGFWEECAGKGSTAPARAAALRLGEMHLNGGETRSAVAALAQAVRGLERSADWPDALLPRDRACALFERGCELLRQKNEHELALQLAELYGKLAEPGRNTLLRAEAALAWAQELRQASETSDRQRDLFREAGGDFRRTADATGEPPAKAERLGQAGRAFLAADEHKDAAAALEAFVGLSKDPTGLGEGWFLLGQAQRQLGDKDKAEAAYKEALKYPTRFAYRARFQLSQLQLARNNTGLAEETLEQNVKLLRLQPDNEALEQSLYSLATLLFDRRHFSMVPFYLDDALARFPDSPQAVRGRFQLAESYRQLAAQENLDFVNSRGMAASTREHHWKQHRHWLEKAGAQYLELTQRLEAAQEPLPLKTDEVVHALFSAAECRFNLGDYAASLAMYERLVEKYRGRADQLKALGGCVRCHAARNDADKVQQCVQQIRLSLGQVDDATRKAWEGWLSDASKRYALASE